MIQLWEINKIFNQKKASEFRALRDVTLALAWNKCHVIKGPSGSGKTTLLSIIGCMSRPTSGRIVLREREITSLPERFLTQIRRKTFGFIFQQPNLIKGLTVLENTMLPVYPLGIPAGELKESAMEILSSFQLDNRAKARVDWLSGGEAQRVAIARALINDPKIIIADEPTAHLDRTLAKTLLGILERLKADGKTILAATHDPFLYDADLVDQVFSMRDGSIVG